MNYWINEPKDINDYVGFVYIIKNEINGRYYIGQKKYWSKLKLKPLKGKKLSRYKVKESDWKTYYGSCKELQNDVVKYGKDNFERTILYCCKSKAEMNYIETYEQLSFGCLLDDNSYNGIINCRTNKMQIQKVKDRLNKYMVKKNEWK
jgi:hypothetical protein